MAGRTGRVRVGRKDGNHNEIVAALIDVGVVVADTSGVGNGFNDIVCAIPEAMWLVEIKMPGETLTAMEKTWHRRCPWRNHVVWTVEQALAIVEYYRDQARARPKRGSITDRCQHGNLLGSCPFCPRKAHS